MQAKAGAGSATLSMAYAGAEFAEKIVKALNGEKGIVTPTFVSLSSDKSGGEFVQKELGKDIEYFSTRVELGVRFSSLCSVNFITYIIRTQQPEGVEKILPIGETTHYEKELISAAIPELEGNIAKVFSFDYSSIHTHFLRLIRLIFQGVQFIQTPKL